jgi:hypothetical protein
MTMGLAFENADGGLMLGVSYRHGTDEHAKGDGNPL